MIDDGFEIFRRAAYREIRELALSVAERGPTHEAIRQALADVLDDLDTDPGAPEGHA